MEMILFVLGQQVIMFLSLLYLGFVCKRYGMSLKEYLEEEDGVMMVTRVLYFLSFVPIMGALVSVAYFIVCIVLSFIIMSEYKCERENPSSIVALIDKILKNI